MAGIEAQRSDLNEPRTFESKLSVLRSKTGHFVKIVIIFVNYD